MTAATNLNNIIEYAINRIRRGTEEKRIVIIKWRAKGGSGEQTYMVDNVDEFLSLIIENAKNINIKVEKKE